MAIDSKTLIADPDTMAALLGIKRARFYQLVKDGLPSASRGKYHAPTAFAYYLEGKTGEGKKDVAEQRQLLYKAQTEKTELENAQTREELLRSEVVSAVLMELGTSFRTSVESIEPRLARMLSPEQVATLRAEIKAVLEDTAKRVETYANTRDDSRDNPATT